MAHYAWINKNSIVINVTVGVDETELLNGLDPETFYSVATGYTIKRTSYNNNIRKQYAGKGFTYDAVNDVFIALKPYPSWALDNNFNWQAPTPRPEGNFWYWSEQSLEWIDAKEL